MKIIILFLLFVNVIFASVGHITSVVGKATISRDGKENEALVGFKLEQKDTIKTYDDSKLRIILTDDSSISLGQNSTLNIEEYILDSVNPKNSKSSLNFLDGAFKSVTGGIGKINPNAFKLKTKAASIGIRGTTVVGTPTSIACTSGAIDVSAAGETVFVEVGQITDVFENEPPTLPRLLDTNELKALENMVSPKTNSDSLTFKTTNSSSQDAKVTVKTQNGEAVVNEDNSITYKPKEGFKGSDTVIVETTKDGVTTVEVIEINSDEENIEFNLVVENNNIIAPQIENNVQSVNNEEESNEQTQTNVDENSVENEVVKEVIEDNNDSNKTVVVETKNITFEAPTSSQSTTIVGSGIYYNSSDSYIDTTNKFEINIDKSSGFVDGNINDRIFYGIKDEKTSYYYLGDDSFASKGDINRTDGLSQDSYIKAVNDSVTSNGEKVYLDDDTSWGYWLADFESIGDEVSKMFVGTWIAGIKTSEDIIQEHINKNSNFIFEGHMIGNVLNYGENIDSILLNTNNKIVLNMDFGSSTNNFNGTFNFDTNGGQNWNGSINNGVLNTTSFSSTDVTGLGNNQEIINSSINGSYFGENELKSVGGEFTMQTETSAAYGTFKATK